MWHHIISFFTLQPAADNLDEPSWSPLPLGFRWHQQVPLRFQGTAGAANEAAALKTYPSAPQFSWMCLYNKSIIRELMIQMWHMKF